jgi:hypothetical protein
VGPLVATIVNGTAVSPGPGDGLGKVPSPPPCVPHDNRRIVASHRVSRRPVGELVMMQHTDPRWWLGRALGAGVEPRVFGKEGIDGYRNPIGCTVEDRDE